MLTPSIFQDAFHPAALLTWHALLECALGIAQKSIEILWIQVGFNQTPWVQLSCNCFRRSASQSCKQNKWQRPKCVSLLNWKSPSYFCNQKPLFFRKISEASILWLSKLQRWILNDSQYFSVSSVALFSWLSRWISCFSCAKELMNWAQQCAVFWPLRSGFWRKRPSRCSETLRYPPKLPGGEIVGLGNTWNSLEPVLVIEAWKGSPHLTKSCPVCWGSSCTWLLTLFWLEFFGIASQEKSSSPATSRARNIPGFESKFHPVEEQQNAASLLTIDLVCTGIPSPNSIYSSIGLANMSFPIRFGNRNHLMNLTSVLAWELSSAWMRVESISWSTGLQQQEQVAWNLFSIPVDNVINYQIQRMSCDQKVPNPCFVLTNDWLSTYLCVCTFKC